MTSDGEPPYAQRWPSMLAALEKAEIWGREAASSGRVVPGPSSRNQRVIEVNMFPFFSAIPATGVNLRGV